MRADREIQSPVHDWEQFDRLTHDGAVWIVKEVRRGWECLGEPCTLRLMWLYEDPLSISVPTVTPS
jgi:hypothetical protein